MVKSSYHDFTLIFYFSQTLLVLYYENTIIRIQNTTNYVRTVVEGFSHLIVKQ